MTKQRQAGVWAALTVFAMAMFVGVGAQGQQESQAPTQSQMTLKGGVSYTDQSTASCEEQNADNPFVGMNPLVCHGAMAPTDSNGECTLNIGSVWKKEGSYCFYCSPINPPIKGIIVPTDQVGAAGQQGFRCGADQADACMAVCSGGTTFTPPPGVQGGVGSGFKPGPVPNLKSGVPMGGPPPGYAPTPGPAGGIGYVPGANPCLPQGPGGYDYCQNGPGARLPAGCVCGGVTKEATLPPAQKPIPAPSPQPPLTADASDVCSPMSSSGYAYCVAVESGEQPKCGCDDDSPPPSAVSGKLTGSAQANCQTLLQAAKKLPKFSKNDLPTLQQAVSDAKTMLTSAKTHVDKWDASAQSMSKTYFHSTSSDTQKELSFRIDGELTLLNGMTDPTKAFFTDLWASGKAPPGLKLGQPQKWAVAYVYPDSTSINETIVFLKASFFAMKSGASRATTVVHELSHLNSIASTEDLAYGRSNCSELAAAGELSQDWQLWISKLTLGLNQNGTFPLTLAKPAQMKDPLGYQLILAPTPVNAALMNADSFSYFVQDLSQK